MYKIASAALFFVLGLIASVSAADLGQSKPRSSIELTQTTPEQQEALNEAFWVMAANPSCGIRIVYFEDGRQAVLPDESPECLAARAKSSK